MFWACFLFFSCGKGPKTPPKIRKRGGVQKSMGNKVPWKTGVPIYLPVTSRPLISLQKEAVLHPCNFATTHLTARILNFYLPWTSRPMKRRTLSQRPIKKSYRSYFRRAQIRWVIWPSSKYWFFLALSSVGCCGRFGVCFFPLSFIFRLEAGSNVVADLEVGQWGFSQKTREKRRKQDVNRR